MPLRTAVLMAALIASVMVLSMAPLRIDAAVSTQLYGDGSANAKPLLDAWALSYSYVRDDVSIGYAGAGTAAALEAYTRQTVDFVGTDRGITADLAGEFGALLQFPLWGQAMVVTYNVDGLDPDTDPYLVLDRETLGLVWAGVITQWNDSRIQALNPPAVNAKLPAADITLGYTDYSLSFAEVFKVALSSFSDVFRTALASANGSFALMPPALAGRATDAGTTSAGRATWVQNNSNSMTLVTQIDCLNSGLPWVNMVNKAGKVVAPSVYSVQAAMAQFAANFSAGNLAVDIVDAPGNDSWPLSYTTFLAINRSITALDCTNIEELMHFIAWTQINDGASVLATSSGRVPIDVSLRKNILDLFTRVRCNGEQALATSYLVGAGPPLPLYTAWAVAQSTSASTIKYFEATSAQAKQQLRTFDEQFGATSNGLEAEWYSAIPDVALVPATIYAIVPGYNMRELDGLELVLDFETIAAIYMADITLWNDTRIKALNSPAVADALPAKPIVVVTQTSSSAITELFTAMLSAKVAAFGEQVGSGDQITFPVQDAVNQSIEVDNYTALVATLADTSYGFAFINNYDAVLSALSNYLAANSNPAFSGIVLSAESWPLATFGSFFFRSKTMEDCNKAAALASFLYYSQTDPEAKSTADRQGFIQASTDAGLQRRFLNLLKAFTCDGVAVSTVAGCINDGGLCSDAGVCANNTCICDSGREGQYCAGFVSASSSSDASTITIAVIIPVVAIILLVLVGFIVVLVLVIKRRGNKSDDWEIEYSELEVGEQLGAGGYGEVHKAMWKGTEVAVKVIAAEKITKDMEKSFQDEVRVMTSLRHPNVVLFMAASTKPPKMCIVMEFMALGSLYDLLHNELVPEIPFQLKAKMAYQASKGMHFLHSSGIVHRDLKSLNLLLDNKWNVKVSDFGLTRFKEDVKKGGGGSQNIVGSVHWTAPEVLNESSDVDFILADVYSFGIILWELLSREQPYFGMSPAAVAVAVIRDGIRPHMPDSGSSCPPEYEELVTSCWHSDPVIRPTFLEIMTRLSSMHGDSTSGGVTSFTSRTTTSSSSGNSGGDQRRQPNKNMYGSWTLPSTNGSATSTGSSSSSSNASRNLSAAQVAAGGGVRAPEGEVAIVFTDITRAASLWEFNAGAMRDATLVHNDTLRAALKRHRGYEVVFLRDRNSGEGSFCMAFQQANDALAWCADVQQALLAVEWPEALLEHPGAAEEWGDTDDRVLFKGLRVRMGVHVGTPKVVRDPMTRRVEYIGPVVNAAARITAMTHGGQIVVSHAAHDKIVNAAAADDGSASASASGFGGRMVSLGKFEMADVAHGARLYELKVEGLEGRFFGGVTKDGDTTSSSGAPSSGTATTKEPRSDASGSSGGGDGGGSGSGDMQTAVGEGMMFKEDTFLTSANLCRWIIDFGEVQVGKQVGLGSYGVVFRGKWKGVDVAVKRFIKQKLDERRMLEFRAEMAFLSELHHPNIVLFIGACVKKPNLCIVTEFMKLGSLRDILANNNGIKLAWKQKLRLLRSAALGINYLHSLHPVIVHRDVKPSNLLVDENWNVKVADFGFARIKEENATMTRCGTPCWTAPEIIRGDKYDERADVFSFGVVMWQVVTRREPFAGRNFMGVSLDVLEGKRPQIPGDCPPEFRKVMKKCWHANADKRPRMEDVVAFLDKQVGDDDDAAAPGLTMPV